MMTIVNTSNQTTWLYTAVATTRVTNISSAPTYILTTSDMHFGLLIILQQGFPTNVTLYTGLLIYAYFTIVKCLLPVPVAARSKA